ncbi:hypothetical protein BZA77DRAFT_294970 [Pyronema omphalodes]|nr:hypothetical protein BZA77DRAFT_294970 [Pyronema omphalodes]
MPPKRFPPINTNGKTTNHPPATPAAPVSSTPVSSTPTPASAPATSATTKPPQTTKKRQKPIKQLFIGLPNPYQRQPRPMAADADADADDEGKIGGVVGRGDVRGMRGTGGQSAVNGFGTPAAERGKGGISQDPRGQERGELDGKKEQREQENGMQNGNKWIGDDGDVVQKGDRDGDGDGDMDMDMDRDGNKKENGDMDRDGDMDTDRNGDMKKDGDLDLDEDLILFEDTPGISTTPKENGSSYKTLTADAAKTGETREIGKMNGNTRAATTGQSGINGFSTTPLERDQRRVFPDSREQDKLESGVQKEKRIGDYRHEIQDKNEDMDMGIDKDIDKDEDLIMLDDTPSFHEWEALSPTAKKPRLASASHKPDNIPLPKRPEIPNFYDSNTAVYPQHLSEYSNPNLNLDLSPGESLILGENNGYGYIHATKTSRRVFPTVDIEPPRYNSDIFRKEKTDSEGGEALRRWLLQPPKLDPVRWIYGEFWGKGDADDGGLEVELMDGGVSVEAYGKDGEWLLGGCGGLGCYI